MSVKSEQKSARMIGKIVSIARKKLGKSKYAMAERFIKRYYTNIPSENLRIRKPEYLAALALNHLKMTENRKPGQDCVRIFNPTISKDGWTSKKSSLEIVTGDKPFLVDSITAELSRLELDVHVLIHPMMKVVRTPKGTIRDINHNPNNVSQSLRESFMHFEITAVDDEEGAEIIRRVKKILNDVRNAVEDWQAMRDRMQSLIEEIDSNPIKGYSTEDTAENRNFLSWIHDNHFTFLGCRDYTFKSSGKHVKATVDKKSELGT